jgi:hypothetical protein
MSILYDYPTIENEHDETITQTHAFIDRMTRISQHHSCGSFYSGDNGVLQDLMSKASIRGNLTGFAADIAVVKQTGLTYVLGETNSFSCHSAPGVSNTAGAALWAWITPCLQATSGLLGYISIKASVISTISYGVILSEARDRSGTICQQVELSRFSFSLSPNLLLTSAYGTVHLRCPSNPCKLLQKTCANSLQMKS